MNDVPGKKVARRRKPNRSIPCSDFFINEHCSPSREREAFRGIPVIPKSLTFLLRSFPYLLLSLCAYWLSSVIFPGYLDSSILVSKNAHLLTRISNWSSFDLSFFCFIFRLYQANINEFQRRLRWKIFHEKRNVLSVIKAS